MSYSYYDWLGDTKADPYYKNTWPQNQDKPNPAVDPDKQEEPK